MLKNKCVVLGVTGSIAAYKIASLASALKKQHCDVQVIMTRNAAQFITPVTFETLTGNKCLIDTFDRNFTFEVEHISVAKKADLVLVAPASANIIGKLAHGIADDMLTTTILACKCPKLLSPAMNTAMFENPVVQDNLSILKKYGWKVIEPASGYLACGDTGAGKMPEPEVLLSHIEQHLACEKDLLGKKVLVTAGSLADTDVVGYSETEAKACFAVLHFSGGNLLDKDYEVFQKPEDRQEAVSSLMKQYYLSRGLAPKIVLLPFELEDSELFSQLMEQQYGRRSKIRIPQKGDNMRLVELANKNAFEEAQRLTQKDERINATLVTLGKMLAIPTPSRMESYDISNISGTDIVASMVVFQDGKPKKSEYKRFKIQDLPGQDDYASMHQVPTHSD